MTASACRARSASAAGRRAAHRRSETRRTLARWRGRHDRGEGPQRVQGLLAHAGKDRGRVPRRRLLHHRRPRHDRTRRLCVHRRPRQGSHHLRRLQCLSEGGRDRDRRACRASRERRDRLPHQDFGEGVTAVIVKQPGAASTRRRTESARRPARQVQAAESRDVRRRAAAQHHGQGAEERAARAL